MDGLLHINLKYCDVGSYLTKKKYFVRNFFIDKNVFAARDVGRGKTAVAELEKEGLKPNFHQLDVSDTQSITALRDYLKEKYGGLDLLVNNAAIAYKVILIFHFR